MMNHLHKISRSILAAVLLLAACAGSLGFAQEITARISGQITDAAGACCPQLGGDADQ